MSNQVKSRPRKSSGLVLSCLVLTSSALAFEFCSRRNGGGVGSTEERRTCGLQLPSCLGPQEPPRLGVRTRRASSRSGPPSKLPHHSFETTARTWESIRQSQAGCTTTKKCRAARVGFGTRSESSCQNRCENGQRARGHTQRHHPHCHQTSSSPARHPVCRPCGEQSCPNSNRCAAACANVKCSTA